MAATPTDLFAFGSKTGPRLPRAGIDVFPDNTGRIGPELAEKPQGASTFANPSQCPLHGHYHVLPAGTELPEELGLQADGMDINPDSVHPPTHYTLFPRVSLTVEEFNRLFQNLPWKLAGKNEYATRKR